MEKYLQKIGYMGRAQAEDDFKPPKMLKKAGILPLIFLWAEFSTRDAGTEKLKLVASQPTW